MKLSIISFTENGRKLSENLAKEPGIMEIRLFTKYKAFTDQPHDPGRPVSFVEESVGQWAKKQMQNRNAMLFIGACGIAVRAIAPHLVDKLHDSPVLVMDEGGRYVIPILSGHMGGANELAQELAERTGAEPVITTATDRNGKFAVDLFAKRNGLFVVNKEGIARVSARALAGEEITMSIETGYESDRTGEICREEKERRMPESELPAGIRILPYPPKEPVDVLITSEERPFSAALLLRPREYILGIGCKKGKCAEELEAFLSKKLKELGIGTSQILAVSSVSRKQNEPGILAWCQKERIPFWTYGAEELQAVEGNFSSSSFVKKQVGVDNVCERAAIKACGPGGKLISPKYAGDGMTVAVAKRKWSVNFDET